MSQLLISRNIKTLVKGRAGNAVTSKTFGLAAAVVNVIAHSQNDFEATSASAAVNVIIRSQGESEATYDSRQSCAMAITRAWNVIRERHSEQLGQPKSSPAISNETDGTHKSLSTLAVSSNETRETAQTSLMLVETLSEADGFDEQKIPTPVTVANLDAESPDTASEQRQTSVQPSTETKKTRVEALREWHEEQIKKAALAAERPIKKMPGVSQDAQRKFLDRHVNLSPDGKVEHVEPNHFEGPTCSGSEKDVCVKDRVKQLEAPETTKGNCVKDMIKLFETPTPAGLVRNAVARINNKGQLKTARISRIIMVKKQ